MKNLLFTPRLLAPLLAIACLAQPLRSSAGTARETLNFDADWLFLNADPASAEQSGFDALTWRWLSVPHDWSIEGPFDQQNKTAGAGAFLPGNIGWYRKHFSLPAKLSNRRVFVEFDGVMANSDVWINGHLLGRRPFGYVSFRYELTDHLKFGHEQNVLAVRADNSQQPASRWYTGAGIYRHVRLVVTDAVHFEHWGNFITTSQRSDPGLPQTIVQSDSTVVNQSEQSSAVSVEIQVYDPKGKMVAMNHTDSQTIAPGQSAVFAPRALLLSARLWNLDSPELYRAVLRIRADDQIVDEESVPFGVRTFEFRADTGFWLNGKNFKLKGVCLHHAASAFGAAVPLDVWERRLNALRKLGVNAIRTAHNPPAPDFLDLCDRMGFLVMDELFDCWTVGKNRYDYHLYFDEWSKVDLRDTIRRDRNHPSIILYSVGNEIHDTPKQELAKGILKGLVEVCHANDPTRPVTQALFRPNVSHDYDNGLADMLDVIGTNYRDTELLAAQRAKPTRKIIGTEQRHDRQTWLNLRDNPSHSGQFLWTGIDYLGEAGRWPLVAHASGLIDRTGEIKPLGYERQSWWSETPVVHIARRVAADDLMPTDPGYGGAELHTQVQFADWTPSNPAAHDENVEVFSNCEEVELFLNQKSLGTKKINVDASPRVWKFAFAPGTLKAMARNHGRTVASDELRTAGKPAKIILTADRSRLTPGWDEVVFVTATVTDFEGVVIPNASDLINFSLTGPGVIANVDSANNASHEDFLARERHAFGGRCVAAVKATASSGRIKITATAPGLHDASVFLRAVKPEPWVR